VNFQDELFLLDCGEATQMQMRKYNIKFQRINHIFITHLHGDHYLGIMGLLFTYHLLGREKTLHIYASPGLRDIINLQIHLSGCSLVYPIQFHPLNHSLSEKIFENDKIIVETIPMIHRIPTSGFIFREKQKLKNIRIEALADENPSHDDFENIRRGADFISPNGKIYPNDDITVNPPPSRSFSHCSDTLFSDSLVKYIKNSDLLYCEATFSKDKADKASEKFHCTTEDAAMLAKIADARRLIIGHFSARYEDIDLNSLLLESKNIFPNTELAIEGSVFNL
jgi:ribonuclease Z